MKVTAIAKGYYGSKVRDPGEVFDIESKDHFSKTWMVREGSAPRMPSGRAVPPPDPAEETDAPEKAES